MPFPLFFPRFFRVRIFRRRPDGLCSFGRLDGFRLVDGRGGFRRPGDVGSFVAFRLSWGAALLEFLDGRLGVRLFDADFQGMVYGVHVFTWWFHSR